MGSEDDDDGGYNVLAPSVQRRIDDAFDSAALSSSPSSSPPSPKRRKLDGDHTSPHPASSLSVRVSKSDQVLSGGFLLDDPSPAVSGFLHDDSPPPGGFLPEPSISQHSDPGQDDAPTHIPLSFIPTALRVLNVQPDDEVLSVFRNAASGWNHGLTSDDPQDDLVSRRDWRAVCAALLDTGLAQDDVDVDVALSSTSDGVVANMEEPSDSGEEYAPPGSDSDNEEDQDSDDDYHESGFLRSKRPARKPTSMAVSKSGRGRGRRPGAVSSEDGSETSEAKGGLNAQQKKECRAAFALFFPDARDELLDKMRIRIKDITRIAALIKEKLSTEEVVEMLEAFSSSSDKSVGLDEFERMMVATKLV